MYIYLYVCIYLSIYPIYLSIYLSIYLYTYKRVRSAHGIRGGIICVAVARGSPAACCMMRDEVRGTGLWGRYF